MSGNGQYLVSLRVYQKLILLFSRNYLIKSNQYNEGRDNWFRECSYRFR